MGNIVEMIGTFFFVLTICRRRISFRLRYQR